jgi:hypothetical protein
LAKSKLTLKYDETTQLINAMCSNKESEQITTAMKVARKSALDITFFVSRATAVSITCVALLLVSIVVAVLFTLLLDGSFLKSFALFLKYFLRQ